MGKASQLEIKDTNYCLGTEVCICKARMGISGIAGLSSWLKLFSWVLCYFGAGHGGDGYIQTETGSVNKKQYLLYSKSLPVRKQRRM